jgi:hypothetical protein
VIAELMNAGQLFKKKTLLKLKFMEYQSQAGMNVLV